ncbi:MAG TPA: hypothetical protein VFZ63_06470 [Jiangellaceae bacterium]
MDNDHWPPSPPPAPQPKRRISGWLLFGLILAGVFVVLGMVVAGLFIVGMSTWAGNK